MKLFSACLAITLGMLALPAMAQAPAAEAAKPAAREEPAKKAPPREAKKVTAPKEAKKPAGASTTQVSKNVTVYNKTPPPALKDKQGKDIPVTPDAYDVSSALPKKK